MDKRSSILKRVMAIVLSVLVIFGALPMHTGMAFATEDSTEYIAAIGDEKYETLQQAVDAAEGETVITLLGDAKGDGIVVAENSDITFDFAGYTYTVDGQTVGSLGMQTDGMQFLKDSDITLKNGTVKAGSDVKILVQNYSNLSLESFTIDATDALYEYAYALSNNCGDVLITGTGDIISNYCAFDLWYGLGGEYLEGVSVTFDEGYMGKVTGLIEYGAEVYTPSWKEKTVLTIKSGNFDAEFSPSSEFYFADANITVYAGRFTNPLKEEWCAQGFEPAVFDDGYYGVCDHLFTQKITDGDHFVSGPTCSDGDIYYYDCAKCDKIGRETFDCGNSLGHSFTSYIYNNDASCTQDGTLTAVCDREGCSETDTQKAKGTAKGHHFSSWVVTVNATCTQKGKQERQCALCGEKEEKEIVGGHILSNVYTIDKEATCTEDGSKSYHCLICGSKENAQVIKKTGHKNTVTKKTATESKDGFIKSYCSVCKTEEIQVINKIGEIRIIKDTFNYLGREINPTILIKDSKGNRLKKGTDFVIKYSNNKEVGTGNIRIIFKGNYSGEKALTFKIILPSPSVKATVKNLNVNLSWAKIKGADSYKVFVYNPESKKYELFASTKKRKLTVKEIDGEKLEAGKTYKFRVKAVVTNNNETYESKYKDVNVLTNVNLVAAESGKAKEITVLWDRFTGANGYEVVCSTSKKFAKKTTKKVIVKKEKTKKTTVKNLASGKTYFVKVRAYKIVNGKKIYGTYSKVQSVKVK